MSNEQSPIPELNAEQVEYVQHVLTLAKARNTRFEQAQRRRQLLANYIGHDEMPPPGPVRDRLELIKGGAEKVIRLLGSLGEAFNAAHPDDTCTAHDFVDILMTAAKSVRSAIE